MAQRQQTATKPAGGDQPTGPAPQGLAPNPAPTDPPEDLGPLGDRSPTAEEHPTSVWICENPRCPYQGKKRRVRWAHLGNGLYLVGTVRCHCGHLPVAERRGRLA